jgi:SAM-dependent methyltransferase
MKRDKQEIFFLESEANNYFDRNGAELNKMILSAIKFLKPRPNSRVVEIGCSSGINLKKIKSLYHSRVSGLDPSIKAVNYGKKKYKLNNLYVDTFLNYNFKNKFDIVIDGGFLYLTPNKIINQTLKKIFTIMKINSYFILWEYDTPYSYTNTWKHNKKIKSYKRNYINLINKINKNLFLISKKYYFAETHKKIKHYNSKTNIDDLISVMIFKKINPKQKKNE